MIKNEVYERAFERAITKKLYSGASIVPVISIGVKYINIKEIEGKLTRTEVEMTFEEMSLIITCMSCRTPREFINIFPILKVYDGDKFGEKDYYSTLSLIKALPQDKPLGPNINKLLFEYSNLDIIEFPIRMMLTSDSLCRFDGKRGILEEWTEENNVPIYRKYTDSQGKKFIFDPMKGKTLKIRKKLPDHLRVLK